MCWRLAGVGEGGGQLSSAEEENGRQAAIRSMKTTVVRNWKFWFSKQTGDRSNCKLIRTC